MNAPTPTPLDERKFYAAIRELPGYLVGKVLFCKSTSCWKWAMAQKQKDGQRVWNGKRQVMAHREFYEALMFPIKPGMDLVWLCNDKTCCNPEHMAQMTHSEALKRGNSGQAFAMRQRAKTHCPKGHAYDEENTRWSQGKRSCRTCNSEQSAARHLRNRIARTHQHHQEQQCSAHQ
jgi:hypothetical protein